MKWTSYLPSDIENRLCNCKTLKKDIMYLINAKWLSMKDAGKDKQGFTKEDALVSVLELLECNGQDFSLTEEEYQELIN